MKPPSRVVLAVAATWLMSGSAGAAVLRVPAQYSAIYLALDAAVSGDSVLVAPGTYTTTISRNISLPGGTVTFRAAGYLKEGVTLVSEEGPGVTTINVTNTGTNVHCLVAAGSLTTSDPARVVGFTFMKPNSSSAGILARDNWPVSRLEVYRCSFAAIPGGGQAGGIYVTSGSLRVDACTFTQCTGNSAGGLWSTVADTSASVDVSECEFQACTASPPGYGGGVTTGAAHTRVSRCVFSACQGGAGGGLSTTSIHLEVEDSRFEDNIGELRGGGLYWSKAGGQGWVRGGVFLRNSAVTDALGGAVYWGSASGDLSGCTFVANRAIDGSSASAAYLASSSLAFHNNVIAENEGDVAVYFYQSSGDACNVYWDNPDGHANRPLGSTSRVADPQFCDEAAADYRVRESSPCAEENSNGCGHIGAFEVGCGALPVILETAPEQRLQLVVDGVVRTTPYYPDTTEWAPGTQHTLQAIAVQDGEDPYLTTYWQFTHWSDGGDTTHVVTVPPPPVRYTAHYTSRPKTRVLVQSSPLPSLDLLADGVLVEGQLYWIPGTTHTLEAPSPQPDTPGYEWRWVAWSDGGDRVHDVVVPAIFYMSFVATFSRHHIDGVLLDTSPAALRLQVDADTVTAPTFFSSLEWPPGTPRTVRALTPQDASEPSFCWAFTSWSDGGDTTHVVTPPNGPYDLTATFALEINPVIQVLSEPLGRSVLLDGLTATTPALRSWARGSTHSVGVNSPQPGEPGIEYRFVAWSDGGAAFHDVLVPAEGLNLNVAFAADTLPGTVLRTVPPALRLKADGVYYTTPAYLPWAEATSHTIIADSVQTLGGVHYLFERWEDASTSRTRVLVQPPGQARVTATYSFNDFVTVTIQTSPAGLVFRADDVSYRAPQAFPWKLGTAHIVEVDSLIEVSSDTRYRYHQWSDGGPRAHTITANSTATYSVSFDTQYMLTMLVDPAGQVTPPSGFQTAGASIQILATPLPGDGFRDWVGSGEGSYSGPQNPRTIALGGPVTETARFFDVAYEFSLSLSETDPHVHSGVPAGAGMVHLWLVCGSGAGATRFMARVSGDLPAYPFQPAPGVVNGGLNGDLDLNFDCLQAPMRLGSFWTLDTVGGELCLVPNQALGRLAAVDCAAPTGTEYLWPTDLRIYGIATNGATPCASGRPCTTFSPDVPAAPVTALEAAEADYAVEVRWSVAREAANDGFRVYRSEQADTAFRALNEDLLRGSTSFVWRDQEVQPRTTYFYLVGAVDAGGREQRTGPVSVRTGDLKPLAFAFDAARPNPFVRRTELGFAIPSPARVTCSVYDVTGRMLGKIVDATYPAGEHRVSWEGRDLSGRRMAAGIYFLRLRAGTSASTRKVVMLQGN